MRILEIHSCGPNFCKESIGKVRLVNIVIGLGSICEQKKLSMHRNWLCSHVRNKIHNCLACTFSKARAYATSAPSQRLGSSERIEVISTMSTLHQVGPVSDSCRHGMPTVLLDKIISWFHVSCETGSHELVEPVPFAQCLQLSLCVKILVPSDLKVMIKPAGMRHSGAVSKTLFNRNAHTHN